MFEESRPKNSKPANGKTPTLSHTNKLGKTFCQDKKKKYFKKKRDQKNSTLAIGDNAIEDEKKQNNQGNGKCYNWQKKSHFARKLPETSKKLVLVLASSVPVTDSDKKVVVRVLYIYYLVQFQKE